MTFPKVIYVMGPPGAGKGTQADLLAHEVGYIRFSTGGAFRDVAHRDTELGRTVKNLMENGLLCPPEVAAEVVTTAVQKHLAGGHGIVFDGTPRTVKEAELVDEFFEKENYGKPLAVVLNISRDEMIRRNSKRIFCLDVANDFPILTEADKERCEELDGVAGRRVDDEPSKLAIRWDEFMKHTNPVIQRYLTTDIGHDINGEQPVQAVFSDILELIHSLQANK